MFFGTSIPCAHSARTAALQGGTKCPCEWHAGLPAAMSALSSKIVAKTAPRALQNPGGRYLKPTKIEPGGTHESPDATKSAQHASKRRPRDAQECPKAAQKLPKSAPDAPKTGPGGSQTPPKPSPASPKTRFGRDCARQARSKGSQSDFLRFLALRAMLATCLPIH